MKSRKRRKVAKIVIAPDPVLSTVCDPVEAGEDISHIIKDMLYVLTNSKTGVGISANQVRHTKCIIVVQLDNHDYKVMINPTFAPTFPMSDIKGEGCLSYPGKYKEIERFLDIEVDYMNEQGDKKFERFFHFEARIIQHEIDHLVGRCQVGEK